MPDGSSLPAIGPSGSDRECLGGRQWSSSDALTFNVPDKESMHSTSHGRRRLPRITATAVVAAFAGVLFMVGWVFAASPQRLSTPVTDDAGALTGKVADVEAALNDLQDSTGTQLWVWFTDTLNGQDPPAFATETAGLSDLGPNDLLLVIALDDRAYGYWKGDSVKISDAALGDILSRDLEAGLRSGDEAGAIVRTAQALTTQMRGGATPAPITPGEPTANGSGGSGVGGFLGLGIVAAGIALVGWWFLSGRRRRAGIGSGPESAAGDPNADLRDMKPGELEELANRILVDTDDSIRDSDQELGFAQAQFGDEAAAPFMAAIAAARDDLKSAFTIRQRLDDATPEDDAARRQMLTDLVIACRKAQERLHAETHRFDELRALEKEAPGILATLPAKADALEARLPAAEATLAGLGVYADADWQAVATNVESARTRIAAVRAAVDEGTKALAAGTPGIAAHAARLGEDGLAQGAAFLDAIDRLASELATARMQVDAELVAAVADLERAKAAAAAGPTDPTVAPRLAEAEQLLAEARTALDPPKPDVTGAYDRARRANELADSIEAGIRNAREQQARGGRPAAGRAVGRASGGHARIGLRRWTPRWHRNRSPDTRGRGEPAPRPGGRACPIRRDRRPRRGRCRNPACR